MKINITPQSFNDRLNSTEIKFLFFSEIKAKTVQLYNKKLTGFAHILIRQLIGLKRQPFNGKHSVGILTLTFQLLFYFLSK